MRSGQIPGYGPPFQGLGICMDPVPRALPWAVVGRPVGAGVVRLLTSSATEAGVADEVTRQAWTIAS